MRERIGIMNINTRSPYGIFQKRRLRIREKMREHAIANEHGALMLCSGFEDNRVTFRQNSSFYYLTGITEPGAILLLYLDGTEVLYIPQYGTARDQWLTTSIDTSAHTASLLGVDRIMYLGNPVSGYSFSPHFVKSEYEHLLHDIGTIIAKNGTIFCAQRQTKGGEITNQFLFTFFKTMLEGFESAVCDVSWDLEEMRRTKEVDEITLIAQAIAITNEAQRAAAQSLCPGKTEYEIQAIIDGIFIALGSARPAFPSIVATGKNSTILHYTDRTHTLQSGDLVVIDIGAEFGYYAADITRTYPVSGIFTPRQRAVYSMVLETQSVVASMAKPGMYLNNPAEQDKSLMHIARRYLDRHGLGKYFVHGIGHFLGLDVHDTGDVLVPLRAGDVFTIEPGVYIAEEHLGIRIEDDYVITDDGCFCLSDDLPKEPLAIEAMVQEYMISR